MQTADGHIIVRPDTTWEKKGEDVFLPDFVSRLSFTPVLYAHICKPGKYIGGAFAPRYFDTVGYGLLLYPEDLLDGSAFGMAAACCLDHTSCLLPPTEDKGALAAGRVVLSRDGVPLYSTDAGPVARLEEALCAASRPVYLRTGDLLAVELQERQPLCSRADGSVELRLTWGGRLVSQFKIIP